MATDPRTSLVLAALAMAVERRQPRGVIHHSDQGSRYISLAFGHHCRRSGIRPSTSSVGDCYDDAMAGSFFATLECELPDRTASPTPWSPGTRFFRFIEGWHNARRRHSARGYPSPVAFEERFRGPA